MSKLLISAASLQSGGAERVLSVLSKSFADCFNDISYVLWEGGEPFYPIDCRVKIVSLPEISGKKGRYWQMITFRRLVKREHPDLVLSFLTPYNMLVLLSTVGLHQRIVVAERTDPKRLLAGGKAGLWLRDKLYHLADGILTQTEYAKSCYEGKFASKAKVIFNPVMMREEQVGMALRVQKQCLFVTAGRLEVVKNHVMMIEAFSVFHKTHPGYRLVIYGEGPMRDSLQKMIDNHKLQEAVVLAGRTNNLWNKIAHAEAFLLTSVYEGMSNAMIEALCLGLPVISTKVAGATDLIQDSKNGYLLNVNDIKALVGRMTDLAENPELRQQMGRRATEVYQQVRQDKISKQWIEYLKSKI